MNIDITQLAVAVIGLISAVITAVMLPLIRAQATADQQAVIAVAARTAVYAAQQIFDSGDNQKKKEYAVEYVKSVLEKKHITISLSEISAAIEAALKEIKTKTDAEVW